MDTQVIIAGAGPTGLTLAVDLGMRGVRCVLIEQKEAPQFLPKMERCNARSMEIYRRMGLADRIRAAGLPADVPMDVFIVLDERGRPAAAAHALSVGRRRSRREIAATHDGTLPLEPYQLISQYTLEPLLKSVAETLPSVTVRYGHELLVVQPGCANGVTAEVKDLTARPRRSPRAYLVGCDGGVERGAQAARHQALRQRRPACCSCARRCYRCDELFERIPIGKGRHYHVADDHATQTDRAGLDPALHAAFDGRAATRTWRGMFEQTIGMPVKYEMLYVGEWKQNLLLADALRRGPRVPRRRRRAPGDPDRRARHEHAASATPSTCPGSSPATLEGWGGPKLLALLRRPSAARSASATWQASRYATLGRRKWRSMWRPKIRDDTPEGAARAPSWRASPTSSSVRANEMIGAELGYRYVGSPLVWPEEGEGPRGRLSSSTCRGPGPARACRMSGSPTARAMQDGGRPWLGDRER